MTKRLIRLLFCAGLLLGLLTVTALAAAPEGTGTAEDPYQISSAEELYWFAGLVNDGNPAAHAVLTANITVNENVLKADGSLNGTPAKAWTPIGKDDTNAYTGTFDGQGHTISGLYNRVETESTTAYAGLFGCVGGGGKVKNVNIADSYIYASITESDPGSVDNFAAAGSVCGKNNGGTIENCTNSGTVVVKDGKTSNSACYAGGVCGLNTHTITDKGIIIGCTNSGSVSGYGYVGGVCGGNLSDQGMENCTNSGSVSGSGNVGGVCGSTGHLTVNCGNTGSVSGDGDIGGVCGYNNGGEITNCFSTGSVSGSGNGHVGGVCGNNSSGSITNCFWLDTAASGGIGGGEGSVTKVESKTAEEFASGEVAWLLNSEQENGPWRQKLSGGGDPFPTLDANGEQVVRLMDGSELEGYFNAATLPDPGEQRAFFNTADKHVDPEIYAFSAGETIYVKDAVRGTIVYGNGTPDTLYVFAHDAADKTVPLPSTPARTGYTFGGWSDGSTTYEAGKSVTITADTTFTAQWTANIYTVTLHPNDGTIAEGKDVTSYTYGVGAALPTDVTRRGYTFAGWYDNEELDGDPVTAIPADAIGDVAYWAKWEPVSSGGRPTLTVSQQLINKIKAAKDGDTVEITLKPGQTKLDKEVFETLSGRDVTLVLHLNDEVDWTIYGKDIAADAVLTDLDMGVSMNTTTIPVDLINAITGEIGTVQMTLAHDGEFGFVLTLTAPLGAENEGLWANLYRYDESGGTMTFQTAAQVDKDGNVALRFTHASQYAIVLDDKSHQLPFTDVPEGAWYVDAVAYVYRHDLMDGVGSNLFAPNAVLTRAMAVTILYRLEGSPAVTTDAGFNDVAAGTWYTDAVNWAAANNIVNGVEGNNFDPTGSLTREQMATVLYRYAQYKGADVSAAGDISGFADSANVSSWAVDAVKWAVGSGLVNGVEGNALAPQGTSTRAQAATVLMRFVG